MSTPSIKKGEIERKWLLVDADGQVLGRLASQVASLLKGKHKPQFTPHADAGDFVVVINAEKIKLTGKKLADKMYYRHTGYTGGIVETTAAELMEKKPEDVIIHAVRRMLPRSPLGRKLMGKLHVYAGAEHKQVAQQPEPYELKY
ncbi:MAG: 50S ribosomal protein L13 [Deltaproteobacteria bacterium]|nr:50S ribosomal protein L13 [Deltaproteobacteria bacterium]